MRKTSNLVQMVVGLILIAIGVYSIVGSLLSHPRGERDRLVRLIGGEATAVSIVLVGLVVWLGKMRVVGEPEHGRPVAFDVAVRSMSSANRDARVAGFKRRRKAVWLGLLAGVFWSIAAGSAWGTVTMGHGPLLPQLAAVATAVYWLAFLVLLNSLRRCPVCREPFGRHEVVEEQERGLLNAIPECPWCGTTVDGK